jgi:hypothetical protein
MNGNTYFFFSGVVHGARTVHLAAARAKPGVGRRYITLARLYRPKGKGKFFSSKRSRMFAPAPLEREE